MIAWACVLCTRVGSSAEEEMIETKPATVPSSSLPVSTPASASVRAERLAALTTEGQRCKDEGDHDCVVDRYASAYQLLDHEDRTGRLGPRYVDLMIYSCDELAKRSDVAQYRSRFEVFESIIDLQISEIDSHIATESTKKRGRKARRHRQKDERLQEQRARLEESKHRLEGLLHRLAAEASEQPSPPPAIVMVPAPEGAESLLTTSVPPEARPGLSEQPEQGELEAGANRRNTRRLILGGVGIAGGSLATLSGISLMINGAAWNSCNRKNDDTTSDECSGLVGASRGIFPILGPKPDEEEVPPHIAKKNSVFHWVSGSLVTAIGITAISLGAWAVKQARDEDRGRERERRRDRARARRESIALAPSWSPFSPHQGGLSITGRF